MNIFCRIGLHDWHPTAAIFERHRISKLICTRCGTRKWWRLMTRLPTRPPANPASEVDPARLAYFVALITAIDQSGISPGFARVSHECADGFEITLTISQSLVDDHATHLLTPTCNESLQVADAEHLQGDTM